MTNLIGCSSVANRNVARQASPTSLARASGQCLVEPCRDGGPRLLPCYWQNLVLHCSAQEYHRSACERCHIDKRLADAVDTTDATHSLPETRRYWG